MRIKHRGPHFLPPFFSRCIIPLSGCPENQGYLNLSPFFIPVFSFDARRVMSKIRRKRGQIYFPYFPRNGDKINLPPFLVKPWQAK